MPNRSEAKRSALIEAATERFHRQGINGTALADVARAAQVAPGNMFYHFRTKDELSREVAAGWSRRITASLAELDGMSADPALRLQLFLKQVADRGSAYAEHGCPLAALVRDFRQLHLAADPAAEPLRIVVRWVQAQLAAGGDPDAERHGRFVVAALQGAFVLAHAEDQAAMVTEVTAVLEGWLGDARPGRG